MAQLGGVHLACEGASNILTKVLEWGRLMAYLEQSTRYIPYTDRPGRALAYHVPAELDGHPLRPRYVETLDRAFETYARWIDPMRAHWTARLAEARGRQRRRLARDHPRQGARQPARPPAGGHAVERGHLRHRPGLRGAAAAHARAPARRGARLRRRCMLVELRKVIPAFLTRVDRPERGGAWSDYLEDARRRDRASVAGASSPGSSPSRAAR